MRRKVAPLWHAHHAHRQNFAVTSRNYAAAACLREEFPSSRELALQFEFIADSLEVHFFDAGSVVECDPIDGFHINHQAHEKLGVALAREVEAIGWK